MSDDSNIWDRLNATGIKAGICITIMIDFDVYKMYEINSKLLPFYRKITKI